MFTNSDERQYTPITAIVAYVASTIPEGAKVLEIGACVAPFPRSTHFIDYLPGEGIIQCDVVKEKIPFPDKYFDFVYCRHVVEDLVYPFPFLDEMSRVAKAGYIETPSVASEICRGIDGGSPPWRGYQHHHWFVSNNKGTLQLVRKLAIVEHLNFNEKTAEEMLRNYPIYWNTYFAWNDKIEWKEVVPERYIPDYPPLINEAAHHGYESANKFVSTILDNQKNIPA